MFDGVVGVLSQCCSSGESSVFSSQPAYPSVCLITWCRQSWAGGSWWEHGSGANISNGFQSPGVRAFRLMQSVI